MKEKSKVIKSLFIADYRKRLAEYLKITQFGTERSFIEIELENARNELSQQNTIISNSILRGDHDLLKYTDVWQVHNIHYIDWLKMQQAKFLKKNITKKQEPYQRLVDGFSSVTKYNSIIYILSHRGLIDKNSHRWIPKNGQKTYIVWLLRYLEIRGYFQRRLTYIDVMNIAKNTFGVSIGERTAKNIYYPIKEREERLGIPPADTIP